MALSSSRLASAIKAQWTADPKSGLSSPLSPAQSAMLDSLCNAVAESVVAELLAFAVVSGPVTVASVAGVTPGAGISGPGAGTLAGGKIS